MSSTRLNTNLKLLNRREDLSVTSIVDRHISSTVICQTSTSSVITIRTMSIIVKDFSLLSVLVSVIILHVLYQLF